MDLTDPTTAALLVLDSFDRAGLTAALYGGLLTAAYGEPRSNARWKRPCGIGRCGF